MFLIIVSVLGCLKGDGRRCRGGWGGGGGGGLTSNFLRGDMDVFWNDPFQYLRISYNLSSGNDKCFHFSCSDDCSIMGFEPSCN